MILACCGSARQHVARRFAPPWRGRPVIAERTRSAATAFLTRRTCETRGLTLAPQTQYLADARAFVAKVACEAGFTDARVFDVQVAVSEAAANAIEHGRPTAPLQITTSLFSDRLEVHVFSESKFELPPPDYVRCSGAHRGMGFPLMAKLSDHFALSAQVRGGTLVTLTFLRPGHEHDQPGFAYEALAG